jgi:hypothetical protein
MLEQGKYAGNRASSAYARGFFWKISWKYCNWLLNILHIMLKMMPGLVTNAS